MGLARITEAIFRNEDAVLTVSALLEGEYDEKMFTLVFQQSSIETVFATS